jgi:phosphohistidine phosphatase
MKHMKRVVIVRHAKSDPFGYDDDYHRDLTDRGISDALKISSRLKELSVFPDQVIASPATRTMHTASIYCKNLGKETSSIQQEEVLYGGLTTQSFVGILHKLSDEVQSVFVFGHNPTVHSLVYNLVDAFSSDMPTCATVVIDFDVDQWNNVSARKGKVAYQITPKSL